MRIRLSRDTNPFYMNDPISIGSFIIVLRFHILLRKFKQQCSSFLFSVRKDCIYRWMYVHPLMYLDSICDWKIPQAMQGGPKKQTKAVWLRDNTSLCWAEEKYSAFQRIVLTGELGGSFPASLVVCHWFSFLFMDKDGILVLISLPHLSRECWEVFLLFF